MPERISQRSSLMGMSSESLVGRKRKRSIQKDSNTRHARTGSGARAPLKRQKNNEYDTDESDAPSTDHGQIEEMDIDHSPAHNVHDEENEFLLTTAPKRQLQRLRKDELIRLYGLAGLLDDQENVDGLTKNDLADAIVAARRTTVAPSRSSPTSSNDAEDESDGIAARERKRVKLLRRSITEELGIRKPMKGFKGRSMSLNFLADKTNCKRPRFMGSNPSLKPANLLERHRTLSENNNVSSSASSSTAMPPQISPRKTRAQAKGKGKEKAVNIMDPHDENEQTPRARSSFPHTERTERRLSHHARQPSGQSTRHPKQQQRSSSAGVRQGRHKDTDNAAEEEDELEEQESSAEDGPGSTEEVDELTEEDTVEPEPVVLKRRPQRSPIKTRQRTASEAINRPTQTHTPPADQESDEVDEEVDELTGEDEEGSANEEDLDQEEDVEEDVEEDAEGDEDEENMELRVLRNGKVVGEPQEEVEEEQVLEDDDGAEDDSVEDDEGIEDDEGGEDEQEDPVDEIIEVEEDDDEDGNDEEIQEEDAQEEEIEEDEVQTEAMDEEEDYDLTDATAKSLARLRRDDLVKLCETRDLEVEGTKTRLVECLLHWRDRQSSCATESNAPSSMSTVRPNSTPHPSSAPQTPILFRGSRIHVTPQPQTPPISKDGARPKSHEGELELDLESLGLEDREIAPDKLVKLERIGSGGFKDVYIGKLRGRVKVAIAEFRGQLSAMDIKELKLLRDFDHPNIVRFLGVSIPENTRETPVMIVSELCTNGDLFDYIRNVPPPSLRKVVHLFLDIARGIQYLHLRKPSVIHRDCKSSNILITSRATAKIADFGLAKVKQSTRSMVRSLVGTVNWQAPELWHPHPKYDHKVDVFSCALVFWEALQWHVPLKKYPWEGMNEHAIYDAVGAKRQRPSLSGLRKQWCPEVVDLIEHMWAQDPHDRPAITAVVEELEILVKKYR